MIIGARVMAIVMLSRARAADWNAAEHDSNCEHVNGFYTGATPANVEQHVWNQGGEHQRNPSGSLCPGEGAAVLERVKNS